MTSQEALMILLSLPDEPCLAGRRVHRVTAYAVEDQELVKRDLGIAYVAHRREDHDPDFSRVVSSSTWKRLKIARRA